jgi:acyl-coenzyme A synthetase/AMP-(fatty) acid ligase
VCSSDLEEILYSMNIVKECTTLLTKNRRIIVFIKPNGKHLHYKEIKDSILKKLSGIPFNIDVKLVDSIPRTSTHKVKRDILRKKYQ